MVKVKDLTKELIILKISEYLDKKKPPDTVTPLDHIFPKERYIHSIIQGLVTSLGTQLWENLAKLLAEKNGFVVLDHKNFNNAVPSPIPAQIFKLINSFNAKRLSSGTSLDSLKTQIKNIIIDENIKVTGSETIEKGTGIDLWLRKDDKEYMYDLKTVQINAGGGVKFSLNLCHWHAYRLLQDQSVHLSTHITFPYNPFPGDFWSRTKGVVSPLIPGEDALVADEFWNFISGEEDSTSKIFGAFKEVGDSKILEKYKDKFSVR